MIPIGKTKIESALAESSAMITKIRDKAKANLSKVKKDFADYFNQEEKDYLDKVILCFAKDGFILSNLLEITTAAESLGQPPKQTIFNDPATNKPLDSLTKHILWALRYQYLRSSFYPGFFKKLGVNVCVYCHSQSALTVQKELEDGKLKPQAKFELDHYYPKDDYPFLSICFYNLYPVCKFCNNVKGEFMVDFDLYSELPARNYHFDLSPASVAEYLLDRDAEKLLIRFFDPDTLKTLPEGKKSFQAIFNIQGIYETQKDVAEELIVKSQIYTPAYKAALIRSFGPILSKNNLTNRILIGNYTDLADVHKRPMAKFIQDIALQLGLL
ncbi:MAG TPA: hypothetical protein ENO28_16645 [Bacteroidetes bacterium]|nr:hypothetical protein [Bacteroidota bacterium]